MTVYTCFNTDKTIKKDSHLRLDFRDFLSLRNQEMSKNLGILDISQN